MNEFLLYINTLKKIIDRFYERETVYYHLEEGEWYSREHCRVISNEELVDWVLELSDEDDEGINEIISKQEKEIKKLEQENALLKASSKPIDVKTYTHAGNFTLSYHTKPL